MNDESASEVLEHLGYIRGRVDGIAVDLTDLKTRVTALEIQSAAMSRHLDRLEESVARLERRFDLEEA